MNPTRDPPAAGAAVPPTADRDHLPVSAIAALVIALVVIWFGTLGTRTLIPSDEGRYAEIAREMVVSGDWVTIRYNDLKYFEKPPLHLWMSATAFELFGVGEWQARLGGALAGLLGVVAIGWAARRWYGPATGWIAAALLVSAPAWTFAAHFNSLDITVAGLLAAVLASFLLAFAPATGPTAERRWLLACWALMALAVLAKGLIGLVLPGLALASYRFVSGQWPGAGRLQWRAGLVTFVVIAAPWFVIVSLRNPEFPAFFFIHEHFQRFMTTVHHRVGPIWYFVPIVFLGGLPWTLVALVARHRSPGGHGESLLGAISAWRRRTNTDLRPGLLCACWAGSIFAFFSLSSSKLPGYILPVIPALALLAAPLVARLPARRWQGLLAAFAAFALVLAAVAWPVEAQLLRRPALAELPHQRWLWVSGAGLVALIGALLARRLADPTQRAVSALVLALAMTSATSLLMAGYEPIGRQRAGVALIKPMQARLAPDMTIYSVKRLDHTLPFYLGRTMTMVEWPDELAFGVAREPERWLASLDRFMAHWQDGRPAMAVMTEATRAELAGRGAELSEIARDRSRVVVINAAAAVGQTGSREAVSDSPAPGLSAPARAGG